MANVTLSTVPLVGRYKHTGREPGRAPNTASGNSGSVTFTINKVAAATGIPQQPIAVDRIDFSFGAAPTAPTVQISDGTITWGPHDVVAAVGLTSIVFDPPLLFDTAAAATVVATVADTGPVAKTLSMRGYTEGGLAY